MAPQKVICHHPATSGCRPSRARHPSRKPGKIPVSHATDSRCHSCRHAHGRAPCARRPSRPRRGPHLHLPHQRGLGAGDPIRHGAQGGTRAGLVRHSFSSRSFHFFSNSAEGSVPIRPGRIMPGKRTPGMWREPACTPWKSQQALAAWRNACPPSRRRSPGRRCRCWSTGSLERIDVVDVDHQQVAGFGTLDAERAAQIPRNVFGDGVTRPVLGADQKTDALS